jgi:hypothetical protein
MTRETKDSESITLRHKSKERLFISQGQGNQLINTTQRSNKKELFDRILHGRRWEGQELIFN